MLHLQPHFRYLTENFSPPHADKDYDLHDSPPDDAIVLKKGESINVEPKKMLAYKNLSFETSTTKFSWFETLKSLIFGTKSFVENIFTADNEAGWLAFETSMPKQIMVCDIYPGNLGVVIKQGCYLASTPNIELHTDYHGLAGYLAGKGFATTKANLEGSSFDSGSVYFHTHDGMIKSISVSPEKPVIIDNESLIAYTEGLDCEIKKTKDVANLILSGEGLVNEFKGEGYVFTGTLALGDNLGIGAIFEKYYGLIISCAVIFVASMLLVSQGPKQAFEYLKEKLSGNLSQFGLV